MFSGDVKSYPSFTAAFEALIESMVDNPSECLYFLDHYTSGKAKVLIKDCLQMKSEDLYEVGSRLLRKHIEDCKITPSLLRGRHQETKRYS